MWRKYCIPFGSDQPGVPPPPKWTLDVDYSAPPDSSMMRTESNGVLFDIQVVDILGERATVFFTVKAPLPTEQVMPEQASLRGEGGSKFYDATYITELASLEGVTLGAMVFNLSNNDAPRLALEVPEMRARDPERAERIIPGPWRIPLLVDTRPGQPDPYTAPLMVAKPFGVMEYDNGVTVRFGDTKGTMESLQGVPDITGNIAAFLVLSMSTRVEESGLYLLLMEDGSIKSVSRDEYTGYIQRILETPTPHPTPPNEGTPGADVPATPPANYTPEFDLGKMLEEFKDDLTPTPIPAP